MWVNVIKSPLKSENKTGKGKLIQLIPLQTMRAYDIIFLEVTQSFEKLDRNRIESHIISKEGVGQKFRPCINLRI